LLRRDRRGGRAGWGGQSVAWRKEESVSDLEKKKRGADPTAADDAEGRVVGREVKLCPRDLGDKRRYQKSVRRCRIGGSPRAGLSCGVEIGRGK